VSAAKSTTRRRSRDCAYERMWADLKRWVDEDCRSEPARSTPSSRAVNRWRRWYAEHMSARMDQLEAEEL
jgi:hypothetical protein